VDFNHYNVLNTTNLDFTEDFTITAQTNTDIDTMNTCMPHESMDLDIISGQRKYNAISNSKAAC
jgi:hypothetical protein